MNWGGTVPEQRELFTIHAIKGVSSSTYCLTREVGIGSSMQLLGGEFRRRVRISDSVTFSNNGDRYSEKDRKCHVEDT